MRCTHWRRPSAAPTWRSRSSGWRPRPRASRFASGCRRRAAMAMRPHRSWSGRREPAASCRPRRPLDSPGMRDQGPESDQARRSAASRTELPPAVAAAERNDRAEPDDGGLRQHACLRRKAHARLAAGVRGRQRGGPVSWPRITRRSMPRGVGEIETARCGPVCSGRSSPARASSWVSISARPT